MLFPDIQSVERVFDLWRGRGVAAFEYPQIDNRWRESVARSLQYARFLHERFVDDDLEVYARLFCAINKGHYLVDGNKRTAILVTYIVMIVNGKLLDTPPKLLTKLALDVAKSPAQDFEKMVQTSKEFFSKYLVPFDE